MFGIEASSSWDSSSPSASQVPRCRDGRSCRHNYTANPAQIRLLFRLVSRLAAGAQSFFASLNSTNFSELGFIVATIGVANDWLGSEWLIVLAIAMSLSFAVREALNAITNWL